MKRRDYSLEEARCTMETLTDNCDESMLIVAEYPDIDYVLAYRGGNYQPWAAAWCYNKEKSYWGQGHYFSTLEDAVEYISEKRREKVA